MQLETLEMEMKHIKEDMEEVKTDVREIKEMFNKLDDRYCTRREVRVIVWAVWFLATVLGILWFVL